MIIVGMSGSICGGMDFGLLDADSFVVVKITVTYNSAMRWFESSIALRGDSPSGKAADPTLVITVSTSSLQIELSGVHRAYLILTGSNPVSDLPLLAYFGSWY